MIVDLAELSRALADDELVPHFQPIVELRTGKLSGFEVLARWEHPVHGAVLPANMIELAEGKGLIGDVAQQVFAKAFAFAAGAADQARLSINVSPIQLSSPSLTGQIEALAASSSFPLSRVTIEITESALLSDLTRSQRTVRELKELGCRLSLDDFGTGYSSLAHLQALPFDELKIDRAFVSQMTKKRESRKIVAAIIGLGHSLGLSTVAEGVETEEQADMLLWLGSELGQGWQYGRPAPFHSLRAMMTKPARPAAALVAHPGNDWAVSSLEALPTQRLAQLQAIYDGAPVGLCFLDCHLRYVSMNQRLAEMNGNIVAAHLGNTVRQMVPDFYPTIEPFLRRALEGEAISGVEVQRPSANGNGAWNLNSYQPAFDEADEVIGISISVMDITENKRAQEALQESEFLQRHLVELNQQVPWTMDAQGNDLQMSSKWVRTLSSGKEQARNLGWLEALHVDDLKRTIRKMKKALRTGERIDMEYRVQNTEGEWRWMRSRGLPRLGSNGEVTRWYGSIEDIHDKKCAEAAARKTEASMRALLNAVPVAVIIEEGKQRTVRMSELTGGDSTETAGSPSASEKIQPAVVQSLSSLVVIPENVLQSASIKPGVKRSKPGTTTAKSRKTVAIGLQAVQDIAPADMERQRLVTMLEDFAEYRTRT